MESDDDDDEYSRFESVRRWIPAAVAVLIIAALGFGIRWVYTSGETGKPRAKLTLDSVPTVVVAPSIDGTSSPTSPSPTSASSPARTSSTASTAASTAAPSAAGTVVGAAVTTSATTSGGLAATAITVPTATPTAPATIAPVTTPAPAATTPVTGAATTLADPGYPTNPDGTPQPILVIFDTDTITISGVVPSQAAKDRLEVLAKANSQTPAAVVDNTVINPNVPIGIGVRVIELNSARFPPASAIVLPPHAAELDRVVKIMKALPNITVLVVGHADQRGNEEANFAISDQRARAVIDYFRSQGVASTRLSSRAAGASDLLTLNNDAAALALNRRTEFIFFGLLIE